jgi:hypothetical protein
VVWDVSKMPPKEPIVRPVEEQAPMESQRVWKATADGIRNKQWRDADRAKNLVEEQQRVYLREVDKGTIKHTPRLFTAEADGKYVFRPATSLHAAKGKDEKQEPPAGTPAEHAFTPDDLAGWMDGLKV